MRYPLVDPGRRRRLAVWFTGRKRILRRRDTTRVGAQDRDMTTTTTDPTDTDHEDDDQLGRLQEREIPHKNAHAQERRNDSRFPFKPKVSMPMKKLHRAKVIESSVQNPFPNSLVNLAFHFTRLMIGTYILYVMYVRDTLTKKNLAGSDAFLRIFYNLCISFHICIRRSSHSAMK